MLYYAYAMARDQMLNWNYRDGLFSSLTKVAFFKNVTLGSYGKSFQSALANDPSLHLSLATT